MAQTFIALGCGFLALALAWRWQQDDSEAER
ncbi:hypothetical protein ACVWWG_007635 [Bradyrhizobium sp. LB7.2]